MIKKLVKQSDPLTIGGSYSKSDIASKINELVDAVNFIDEEYNNQLFALSMDVKNKEERIEKLERLVSALVEENNTHERQIDELQMKLKTLQGAFIVRLDENDEPATATPLFKED